MPTAKRRIDPPVIEQLLEHPYRFQFFQAVRILEHVFVRQGDQSADVVSKRLRFLNTLNLGFPASEIEDVVPTFLASDAELLEGNARAEYSELHLESVAITPAFFGLLGVNGALPLTYTERLAERESYRRDRAARAFLDIFNNRAAALFYAAWKKYRLALQYELDQKGRFLPMAKALAGMGYKVKSADHVLPLGDIPDQALAFYCAAIRHRPLSAAYLQRVLSEYFQAPFHIEQMVGGWHHVPDEQLSRVGLNNLTLGASALVGERIWQRDLKIQLRIGPLTIDKFNDFLPGRSGAIALRKWLTLMVGPTLTCEVCLILRADQVRGARLCSASSSRLGWDAFMVTHPVRSDRADPLFELSTLH